jgi:predicted enzyme related to lactoylglutathione lyase
VGREGGTQPVAEIGWVTVDCDDPDLLAAFWSALLGVSEDYRIAEPAQYVILKAPASGVLPLVFQRVSEPKQTKNRIHLDLNVTDLEHLELVAARIEELGGSTGSASDFQEAGLYWRVMEDPAGNEFCLLHLGDREPAR